MSLLLQLTRQVEVQAKKIGETCLVAVAFQDYDNISPTSARVYDELARHVGCVVAVGSNMPARPLPGVYGASVDDDDPFAGEWDVVVASPHFSVALLARELAVQEDGERVFEYVVTYRRDTVVAAARSLLSLEPGPDLPALADQDGSPVVEGR